MNPRRSRCALRAHHEGDHLFIYTIDQAARLGECDAVPLMKVICSWCGVLMRDGADSPVSHGMCGSCRVTFEQDATPACADASRSV